jgi:hypothetical protein
VRGIPLHVRLARHTLPAAAPVPRRLRRRTLLLLPFRKESRLAPVLTMQPSGRLQGLQAPASKREPA